MQDLQIAYVPIDSIKPYANNAKLHPEEQVEQIRKSIEQFGFNDPIALWHGEIVEGHGRLMAAQEIGMETVPVIRLDMLTDEERRAYALAHNKLTMNSGFDFGKLEEELASLEIDMGDFGFENQSDDVPYDGLFADAEPKTDNELKQIKCPHCGEWFTP